MDWHKTSKYRPSKQATYLGCWRRSLIPRDGIDQIVVGQCFYREDGKWFHNAEPLVPEYWCELNYPDFTAP